MESKEIHPEVAIPKIGMMIEVILKEYFSLILLKNRGEGSTRRGLMKESQEVALIGEEIEIEGREIERTEIIGIEKEIIGQEGMIGTGGEDTTQEIDQEKEEEVE